MVLVSPCGRRSSIFTMMLWMGDRRPPPGPRPGPSRAGAPGPGRPNGGGPLGSPGVGCPGAGPADALVGGTLMTFAAACSLLVESQPAQKSVPAATTREPPRHRRLLLTMESVNPLLVKRSRERWTRTDRRCGGSGTFFVDAADQPGWSAPRGENGRFAGRKTRPSIIRRSTGPEGVVRIVVRHRLNDDVEGADPSTTGG